LTILVHSVSASRGLDPELGAARQKGQAVQGQTAGTAGTASLKFGQMGGQNSDSAVGAVPSVMDVVALSQVAARGRWQYPRRNARGLGSTRLMEFWIHNGTGVCSSKKPECQLMTLRKFLVD